jgi:hypothetical protein
MRSNLRRAPDGASRDSRVAHAGSASEMLARMSVHSILPDALTRAVAGELDAAGIEHVAHGSTDAVAAAAAAAADPDALALLGPYRSADIAEAVEASAPAGLALLAPVATWAGVTRDDEPGCDDAARHQGTVLRLVARDTVVAARIAGDVRAAGQRALVVAGDHDYGRQLDGQLRLAGLPRAERSEDADLVVLAGLAGTPEMELAAASAPLPLIAFDGAQGAALGDREIRVALPFEPVDGVATRDLLAGVERARHGAQLIAQALGDGATDRAAMLATLRRLGGFDIHGDPPDPHVWLWHADAAWELRPDRSL